MSKRSFRALRVFDVWPPDAIQRHLDSVTVDTSEPQPIAGDEATHQTSECYDIRVELEHIRPPIWRRFLLPGSDTLDDLHQAIQDSFGWGYDHLAHFATKGRGGEVIAEVIFGGGWGRGDAPDADMVTLADVVASGLKSWAYVYDFGDWWQHRVTVKKVLQVQGPVRRRLLAGKRACPLEDCGGVGGYERMCAFVETGEDPYRDDSEELADWVGDWRPEAFDLEAAQADFDG